MSKVYKIINEIEFYLDKLQDRERIEFVQDIISHLEIRLEEFFNEEATLGDDDGS